MSGAGQYVCLVSVLLLFLRGLIWGHQTPTSNPSSLHSDALQLSTSEAGLFGVDDGRIDNRLDRIVAEVTTKWRHHIAEVAESNTAAVWKLHAATDRHRRATNDLPGELWHSYVHNTGVGNREELVLHGLRGAEAINVTGPALDTPPIWKVLEVDGVFFLFGVYSFDSVTRLHVVKTDLNQLLVQRTVEFSGTDLLVTPYLVRSAHARRQLFIFVKRSSSAVNVQQTKQQPDHADKIHCYTVDQTTLYTRDACIPVSVPDLHSIGDLRVSILIDPVTGQQHVVVIPLQASRVLLVYRLTQLPYEDMYTLGVHASIVNEETVWRVGVFTVAARSYLVAAFGTGSQDEMVQVFRYSTGSFSLIQTISVSSYVIDIQTFHIGFQWYLALAQYDRASLYVWHVDEFQLLQSDPSQLAYKWIPIPVKSCRHELVLAKVYSAGAVDNFQPKHTHFYVHNVTTGRFDVVGDVPCRSSDGGLVGRGLECFSPSAPEEDMLDLSHMIGLYRDNQTYIIIPSLRRQLVVIEVDASVVRTADPVRNEIHKINQHRLKLQNGIEAALRKLQRVEETLADAVVPGGHQILSGDVNIIGGIRAASLSAPSASIGSIRLPGLAGDVGPMIGPISQLADRVNQLQLIAGQLQLRLQDVVLKGQGVHITGYKRFLGSVSADTVYSLGPTHIQRVEQQLLTDILTNIVTSDSSRLIAGTKTFRGDHVAVNGDLHVARINGRPVSDIVTSSHVQQIVGSVHYERGLQADVLTVNGELSDVRPDQLILYNSSSNDLLHVPVVIGTLNANSLLVDLLNGLQPDRMFSSVLMRSGGVFKEPVSFADLFVQQGLHVEGLLNGVDAAGLLTSVVLINRPAHLETLRIGGATIVGPLEVALVNSEQFPGGWYLLHSGPDHQIPLTQKHFLQLQAERVVTDAVDGLQLDQLVTLDTSQRLDTLQVLSANFTGDLTVLGSIDGVAVGRDLLDESFNNETQQLLYVDSLVFDGDVHVRGDIATLQLNGGSLEAAFSNLVPVSEGLNDTLFVNGSITFEQLLSVESLTTTATINGARPADYLTLNTDQVVSGLVHFAQNVWFLNAHSFGLIDGVNITELAANAIFTNRSLVQLVVAGKRFTNSVQFVNVTVNGAINDQSADEVVWTDTNQLIDGVHGYLGGSVQAVSLHVAGGVSLPDGVSVAGLDLSELATALQDPQTGADVNFTMQLQLHQVDVLGSVTVDRINGRPALQLLHKLLGVGTPVVTGRWQFDALKVKGAVSTQLGINGGPHLSQLVNSSVSLTSGGQLLGPLHFNTLLVDAGAAISGPLTLSSVPWPVILDRLVHNSQTVVALNATKTFLSGVSVRDSLLSTALPLHRLLRTDVAQNVIADVTLPQNASLTVVGDVTLRGAVNDLYDINSINQTFVTDSRDLINGDLTLTGPVSVSWMHVHGLVSGHNLTAALRDAIRLDSDVRVDAGLRLSGDVRTPTVVLQGGLLNGRPLDQFLATVRRTDADSHVFLVPVYLPSGVMGHVQAARVHVVGLMNSLNVTQLLQDVMLLNGDLTSQQSWTVEELLVTGHMFVHRLNGVRPEDLLVLDGSVPLPLLHVVGDVFVESVLGGAGGLINGRPLDELLSSLVQLSDDSVVLTEDVSFFGRVFLSGNVSLTGRLNGVNFSQLLPLSAGGTITGNYHFQNGITADHLHVQSHIDGTDIIECARNAVYSDQNAILYGQYQLVNISTHIADDGFVQQANGTVSLQLEDCQRLFNQFNDNYTRQCDDMRQLHSETGSSMYRALRHFELVQRVSWSPKQRVLSVSVVEPLEGVVATAHVLVTLVGVAGPTCDAGDTRLLRWHSGSARLRRVGRVAEGAGAVRDWVQLTTPTNYRNHSSSQLLLVSAVSTSHTLPQCSFHALSSVWRWQNGGLLLVQNLSVEAAQAAAVPELHTVYLVDPVQGRYHEFVYHSGTGQFVPVSLGTHDTAPDAHFTELLAVHALADGSRLVVTADGSTVSVIHRVGYKEQHITRLGTLTASSLHTFRLRGRDMLAVADSGWSSLRSRPQGVKIFEYTSDVQHRCIPVQHLDAVEPSSVSHFTAGSLPDVFLLVVERMHGVRIFIDRGEAGFGEFARLSVPGAVWARALRVNSRSVPYLLVSAGDHLVLFRAHLVGTRSVDPVHAADCRPRAAIPQFLK